MTKDYLIARLHTLIADLQETSNNNAEFECEQTNLLTNSFHWEIKEKENTTVIVLQEDPW